MSNKFILFLLLGVTIFSIIGYFLLNRNVVQSTDMKKQDKNTSASTDLKIEDIKIGTGDEVESGDSVVMHYTGTLTDGTKFDSSYDRNEPFETVIGVGQVIEGWDKGVVGMKVMGKRKLTIPPEMAYGDQAVGPIPANSTLVFEVELLEILK